MGRVAWLVTHLSIVLLLLAFRVAIHEGVNLSQWVARMLFSLFSFFGEVHCQKTLPKAVLLVEKTCALLASYGGPPPGCHIDT